MSNYEQQTYRHADMFKALSNPHRLALFQRLSQCCTGPACCSPDEFQRQCVTDLGEGMEIAPSTLSHHLKELRRAGLVEMRRRGKHVECWVDPQVLADLAGFFNPDA